MFIERPDVSMPSAAMYREAGQDMTYYPMLGSIMRHGWTDGAVKEHAGQFIVSLPLASVGFHALLMRLLGLPGMILADLVMALFFFASLNLLLMRLGLRRDLCVLFSGLVTTTAFNRGMQVLAWISSRLSPPDSHSLALFATAALIILFVSSLRTSQKKTGMYLASGALFGVIVVLLSPKIFWFWNWRFPRPLATQGVYLLALTLTYFIFFCPAARSRTRPALGLGIAASFLLQGSPYQLMVLCVLSGLAMTRFVVRDRNQIPRLIKELALAGIAAAVCSVPFVYQRLFENPDFPRRFGVFPVVDPSKFWISIELYDGIMLLSILMFVLLASRTIHNRRRRRTMDFLVVWLTAAYLALPAQALLTGQLVQIGKYWYEYIETLSVVSSILLLFLLSDTASAMGEMTQRRVSRLVASLGVASSLCIAVWDGHLVASMKGPVRSDFQEWAALPNYRHDFEELAATLQQIEPANDKVLASFDVQVLAWWCLLHPGFAFLPDVAATALSDDEVERRLVLQSRLIAMDETDFRTFLERRYANIFFLGHAKYQASKAFSFAPHADYTAEQQEQIARTTSIYSTFHVIIPPAEMNRLVDRFAAEPNGDLASPDWIVLTNDESVCRFRPPAESYHLEFENSTFRAWKRH